LIFINWHYLTKINDLPKTFSFSLEQKEKMKEEEGPMGPACPVTLEI
jgi:hypothetical protein